MPAHPIAAEGGSTFSEASRDREQRYLLVDQAPMAMAMFDRGMNYLAASRRWIEHYGRGRDELVGLNHYQVHPDIPDEWKRIHARGLAGETLKNDEDHWILADGSEHWLSWIVYPWFDEAGAVGGIIISAEDVTERKRMEAALARSEERLRLALRATGDGLWDWDIATDCLILGGSLWEMAGYHPGEVRGDRRFWRRFVHADDLVKMQALIDSAVIGPNDGCAFDFRMILPGGPYRWMKLRARVAARDATGKALRMVGTLTDIDDAKAIEGELRQHRTQLEGLVALRTEQLQRSERHLMAVLDAVPAMIGYWDRDLRNGFANHAYLDWFGIDPATIPGKHMREVIGKERFALNQPYVEAALRGERQRFERAIPRPDGSGIRHSLADYIPDVRNGEVHGFYVQVSDVTALKASEEALLESKERFRTLFEEAPIGLALFRADGQCIMANAAVAQIVGATREALLQSNFRQLPAWRTSPLLDTANAALETGARQSCEFCAVTSFGILAAIECRMTTVRIDGEQHLLVLAQDITERRLGEAERLAQAERQRDALVREVHHRIKNHLQGVIGLLFERLRTAPQLEPLLEPTIADIQIIAKAYGLQSNRDDSQVVLGQLIELAVQGFGSGRRIACRLPNEGSRQIIPQPQVVPLALVINELLTNAVKHARQPGEKGSAAVELHEEPDGTARVVVRNSPAALPAGFDFVAGRGLGTGLELVRTLLPRKGVSLDFRQDGDGVVAELALAAPAR